MNKLILKQNHGQFQEAEVSVFHQKGFLQLIKMPVVSSSCAFHASFLLWN